MLVCLNDFFIPGYYYEVPPYQRPFLWTRERNLEPLWRSVMTRADPASTLRRGPNSRLLFLGCVLIQPGTPLAEGPPFPATVLDGEQRIIGLQLLVAATIAALDRIGNDCCEKEKPWLEQLIWNQSNPPIPSSGGLKCRVWPQEADRAAFIRSIALEPTDPCDGSIGLATKFFRSAVYLWLQGVEAQEQEARIKGLCLTLLSLTGLAYIWLEPSEFNGAEVFAALDSQSTDFCCQSQTAAPPFESTWV